MRSTDAEKLGGLVFGVSREACGWLTVGLPLGLGVTGNDSEPMLTALTSGFRFRLAVALAAFAAFCFAAPPAVLTFGHGQHTVECLAHADTVNHGMSKANGSDHSLAPGAHQPGSGCCGLFCMSALAADSGEIVETIGALPVLFPVNRAPLSTRAPEQPDRPPISLSVL